MSKRHYDLIILDCDGTLVNTEPLTNRLISQMLAEQGISLSPEECIDQFAGKNIMAITDFAKTTVPDLDASSFETDYRRRCLDIFHDELRPIEGVTSLLKSISHMPICIASNGPKAKMDVTLPAAGIDEYFQDANTFSAYDIGAWKPKPDLFLYAAKQMGVSPKNALVIEDTLSGVMGAVHADIDVWAYNPHLDDRLFLDAVPNYPDMKSIQSNLSELIR